MLRVDELDLAFLSVTERIESHGLGLHQLVSEELVAMLPPEHRLGAPPASPDGRAGRMRCSSASARARACASCCSAPVARPVRARVTLESNESQRIRRLVSRGLGVAILPRSDAEGPGAEVAVVTLIEPR